MKRGKVSSDSANIRKSDKNQDDSESKINYRGLTQHHADELLKKYGTNELKNVKDNSAIKILLHQIKTNYVIYLLLVSFIISIIVGKSATAYTIALVTVIVISVGFIQEYKAEKAVDALKNMLTSTATVIRDGKDISIPTTNLVPEDIIILRSGDKVPADCVVLEEKELRVNESILTGESKELDKKPLGMTDINQATNDNMIFMGTFITRGKCTAKIIHTGMNTRFGGIASMISTAEKELPLQKKINLIIKYMVIFGAAFSIIAGMIMLLSQPTINYDLVIEALIVVLAMAIASFPEGFPVVLITTLAYGAFRMAQKNAIINRMSIIETLGETTIICSDKTGTITAGEMTVKKILVDNKIIDVSGAGYSSEGDLLLSGRKVSLTDPKNLSIKLLTTAGVVCNDSRIEHTGEGKDLKIHGSPTEASLLVMAAKAGIYRDDIKHERIAEIPFSSERKMMSVLVNITNDTKISKKIFSKGAPEKILKSCKYIIINGVRKSLTEKHSMSILQKTQELTSTSYRAMAIAYRDLKVSNISNTKNIAKTMEHGLTLLGIVFIEDPPRPEVKESIKICQDAGITVKMITGDSKETAQAIAAQIGLSNKSLSGEEMDTLTDDELSKTVKDISIFYRVRPEHKLRIVHALKANGEIVTMTGDGVNDAPALKEAHIGVAMGKNGTDVSRESSDLILKDDHFATIVDAIREGRTIFNNIQKFTVYQVSINIAQVMLIIVSLALGLPLPLVAMQILFMNIFSDEVTAITLAFNTYSKDVMNQPPRRKAESNIITRPLLTFMIMAGLIMTIGSVGIFYYVIKVLDEPVVVARTTVFVTMTLFAIVNAFNFRSFRKQVLTRSVFVNKYLFFAALFAIACTMLIIYTPLNSVFELTPLGFHKWIMALFLAALTILLFDTVKFFNNKYHFIDKI